MKIYSPKNHLLRVKVSFELFPRVTYWADDAFLYLAKCQDQVWRHLNQPCNVFWVIFDGTACTSSLDRCHQSLLETLLTATFGRCLKMRLCRVHNSRSSLSTSFAGQSPISSLLLFLNPLYTVSQWPDCWLAVQIGYNGKDIIWLPRVSDAPVAGGELRGMKMHVAHSRNSHSGSSSDRNSLASNDGETQSSIMIILNLDRHLQ